MKVALYARVSSDKQDVDASIGAQINELRRYAANNGHIVVSEFIDEAETGTSDRRPGFQSMIAAAKSPARTFDAILVWKLSRFSRSRADSILYKRLLRKHGVRVVSINEHFDDSPSGMLTESMFEAMDEFYSRNLAQEVTRGMREVASRGFCVGSQTPYGYRRVKVLDGSKERARLEPDNTNAPVVRRIYANASRGLGVKAIAVDLNNDGIPSPGKSKWGRSRVHAILTNEVYVGTLVWGAGKFNVDAELEPVRVVDAHEPLVSRQLFDRVQSILKSRAPQVISPRAASSDYLLSGIVKCGGCRKAMFGASAKSGRYHYYTCATRHRTGSSACSGKAISVHKLDSAVLGALLEQVLQPTHLARLWDLIAEEQRELEATRASTVRIIKSELDDVNRRLARNYEVLEEGLLQTKDLAPRIVALREQRDKLEAQMVKLESPSVESLHIPNKCQVARLLSDFRSLLETGTPEERKMVIRGFIREVVRQDDSATVKYSLPEDSTPSGRKVLDTDLFGGAGGIRTPYLFDANEALSQMSYSPDFRRYPTGCGRWRRAG